MMLDTKNEEKYPLTENTRQRSKSRVISFYSYGLNAADRKLEFGGESPLTMRYGLRVENPTSFGPLGRNCVGYIE